MTPGRFPLLVLIAASCMWGIAWMPLKGLAASGFSGLALVFIASFVAAASLVPRLIAERDSLRGQGAWLLAIAVLGGYANLAFTTATMYGDIVRVMVLFYLLPAWGVLAGGCFSESGSTPCDSPPSCSHWQGHGWCLAAE